MKKRIYTARSNDVSSLIYLNVLRYANPAASQQAIVEFLKKADQGGCTPTLEHSGMLNIELASMRKSGSSQEQISRRMLEISEQNVLAFVRWADYDDETGYFTFQIRSRAERVAIDPFNQTISTVLFQGASTGIARLLLSQTDEIEDARFQNPNHQINNPVFLKEPRRLHDAHIPAGMEVAVAMADDISTWIHKVFGLKEWRELRHEERFTIVMDVVTAHNRRYREVTVAANAVMQLIDNHFSLAIARDTLDKALAIYNFNRQYIKE